jgi:hypothetical protein
MGLAFGKPGGYREEPPLTGFAIFSHPRSNEKTEIYIKIKLFVMKRAVLLPLVVVVLLCVLSPGCTFLPGSNPPATTEPTTPPTPAPTTEPVTTATPVPTPTYEAIQILPRERQVNVVLTKDRPTSEIHLQYQGGPGEMFVNKIFMRVYSSESVYQEYAMSDGKKPRVGDEIVVMGTRGYDRCEVFVISAGTRYKVLDQAATGGGYY